MMFQDFCLKKLFYVELLELFHRLSFNNGKFSLKKLLNSINKIKRENTHCRILKESYARKLNFSKKLKD